jgi:hypothetical protein
MAQPFVPSCALRSIRLDPGIQAKNLASGTPDPEGSVGYSVTPTAAPTCSSSPAGRSPGTRSQGLALTRRPGPDDYWVARRRRGRIPARTGPGSGCCRHTRGRCSLCGDLVLHAAIRKSIRCPAIAETGGPGMPDERAAVRLTHANCRDRELGDTAARPQHSSRLDTSRPLLEPVARKSGTAGSERPGRSNAAGLPDNWAVDAPAEARTCVHWRIRSG